MYFVTSTGEPCDEGAKMLYKRNELPRITNVEIGKVKIIHKNSKIHLIIPVRGNGKESMTVIIDNIVLCFKNLKLLIETEQLRSISIAKCEYIENVPWKDLMIKLRNILRGVEVKIIICLGLVKYVTTEERENKIKENHEATHAGHKRVTKKYKRIRQKYFWENMKHDIQQFIRRCLTCQLKKLVRVKTKNPMLITDTPTTPFEKVALDLVGPFTRTKNDNVVALTMQCALTKYSIAVALPDATAKTVADAFITHFICTFGVPVAILTDQGTNFLSNLMKQIAKRFKIKQFRTSSFHAQSNGSLERSHHVLSQYLKIYISKDEEWD